MPLNKEKYEALIKAIKKIGIGIGGPRLVLLRDDADDVSKGGIIIPDEAQKIKHYGTVLLIGTGVASVPEEFKVDGLKIGYRVTFNAYDGIEHAVPTHMGELPVLVTHVRNVYLHWPQEEN